LGYNGSVVAQDLVGELLSSPALQLATAGCAATRRLGDAFATVGLKPRQFFALAFLHDRGPMSQQALGEALEVDPSILVTLLNPLEADGLASRERDPTDRRRHIVAITERGIARLRDGERARNAAERQLLSALDDDQREQLARLLQEIEPAKHPSHDGAYDTNDPDEC
jgi:DNA-binding MarR family transcriptional regulator